ncbi:A/G-specific adenine glycosylase [Sphingomonas sp. MAH-20]|uniref:Adenine DNA glycosylase n=1 Tax=Sphingomonas horti TaxID=2682842 RepID=A0A6I4J3J5_9SPHN|nr:MULTISPECIES: A/G-specific adenine glycosylase [Sphingomonas]MBA2918791.1 A/G-specific adenine glycosylase [Sphingomonas sp. CGMCC 1.13658]MVO78824.1 A/G-specific adenine glycosylase [Sphingomonas horti]
MRVIAARLLEWYDRHARVLPWRSPPGGAPPDPYRVWLSEVMLQQTTVAAVKPYYERFLARWPSVEALAAADNAELMAAWAGLGYYSRARNLLACARTLVAEHGGRFPGSAAELRRLPGIGDYTAGAIAAIAFGEPAAVVDGNVERVVSRLFALDNKPAVRARAAALTPAERPGDHAQAMMDLGATICTPKRPACAICPVRSDCRAFALGVQEAYPIRPAKAARPHRRGFAYWAEADGHVLLVTRPAKGLLGGMRALPTGAWGAAPSLADAPLSAEWRLLPEPVRHVFTHFSLDLSVACARVRRDEAAGEWWPIERLGEAGLPTLFDKAARLALRERMTETAIAC